MLIQTYFAEAHAPDVMRAIASSDARRPSVQLTLRRYEGEDDDAFYARAQRAALGLWMRCECQQAVSLECVYRVPDDANYFNDERGNTKRALMHTMQSESASPAAKCAAALAFVRIFGPTGYR
jgi:hypothetical protein